MEATRLQGDGQAAGDADRLQLLLDIATAVAGERSHLDALRRLADAAVPALADLCFVDVVRDSGVAERVAAVHADPAKAGLVEQLQAWCPPAETGAHPGFEVIGSGQPAWGDDLDDDFLRASTRSEEHFELLKSLGFTSFMSVPFRADGEILGCVTLVSAGSGRHFGEGDLRLAMELAGRVAAAISSARSRDREHDIAHALQARLLPRSLPWLPGLDMAARYLTGESDAEVGGDFYDVVSLPSGRLGIAVGDIAGHDAGAAALMGQLRAAVRVLAGQIHEPAAVVDALQWSWDGLLGFDRMATAFLARIDLGRGVIDAVSAGHPPPLLVSAQGEVSFLDLPPGPPLGCPGPPAAGVRAGFPAGATLVLYTDGLVERRGRSLDEGLEILAGVVASERGRTADALCGALVEQLTGGADLDDDAVVLAIRSTG